jgi:hypothetical protein
MVSPSLVIMSMEKLLGGAESWISCGLFAEHPFQTCVGILGGRSRGTTIKFGRLPFGTVKLYWLYQLPPNPLGPHVNGLRKSPQLGAK